MYSASQCDHRNINYVTIVSVKIMQEMQTLITVIMLFCRVCFLVVKRLVHVVNNPPSCSDEIKERVEVQGVPPPTCWAFMTSYWVNFTCNFCY
jgi:hypothetical protein